MQPVLHTVSTLFGRMQTKRPIRLCLVHLQVFFGLYAALLVPDLEIQRFSAMLFSQFAEIKM